MNQKEALKLALEANIPIRGHYDESGATPAEIERLVAATIEHCAKVCEELFDPYGHDPWNDAVESCVAHLRGLK